MSLKPRRIAKAVPVTAMDLPPSPSTEMVEHDEAEGEEPFEYRDSKCFVKSVGPYPFLKDYRFKECPYRILTPNNPELIERAYSRRPWWESAVVGGHCNCLWVAYSKSCHFKNLVRLGKTLSSVNHFPLVDQVLTSKCGMYFSIRKYMMSIKKDPFSFIPWSCVLMKNLKNDEYFRFLSRFEYYNERCQLCGYKEADEKQPKYSYPSVLRTPKKKKKPVVVSEDHEHVYYKNIWIIKPSDGLKGRSIQIMDNLEDILNYVQFGERNIVIQKYLENPHLYKGRKYDIRAFGMLRAIKHGEGLEGFRYKDAYLRTSSAEFKLDDIDNPLIHLTNDAVQRKGDSFGSFEVSNKVTMVGYRRYFMDELGAEEGDRVYQSIRSQMEHIMVHCFKSVQSTINSGQFPNCFQLLGFDFLIDDNYKVWLLEINTNPGMTYVPSEQPFKDLLLPRMMEELFQLTVDFYYPSRMAMYPTDAIWTEAPDLQEEPDDGSNRFKPIFSTESA